MKPLKVRVNAFLLSIAMAFGLFSVSIISANAASSLSGSIGTACIQDGELAGAIELHNVSRDGTLIVYLISNIKFQGEDVEDIPSEHEKVKSNPTLISDAMFKAQSCPFVFPVREYKIPAGSHRSRIDFSDLPKETEKFSANGPVSVDNIYEICEEQTYSGVEIDGDYEYCVWVNCGNQYTYIGSIILTEDSSYNFGTENTNISAAEQAYQTYLDPYQSLGSAATTYSGRNVSIGSCLISFVDGVPQGEVSISGVEKWQSIYIAIVPAFEWKDINGKTHSSDASLVNPKELVSESTWYQKDGLFSNCTFPYLVLRALVKNPHSILSIKEDFKIMSAQGNRVECLTEDAIQQTIAENDQVKSVVGSARSYQMIVATTGDLYAKGNQFNLVDINGAFCSKTASANSKSRTNVASTMLDGKAGQYEHISNCNISLVDGVPQGTISITGAPEWTVVYVAIVPAFSWDDPFTLSRRSDAEVANPQELRAGNVVDKTDGILNNCVFPYMVLRGVMNSSGVLKIGKDLFVMPAAGKRVEKLTEAAIQECVDADDWIVSIPDKNRSYQVVIGTNNAIYEKGPKISLDDEKYPLAAGNTSAFSANVAAVRDDEDNLNNDSALDGRTQFLFKIVPDVLEKTDDLTDESVPNESSALDSDTALPDSKVAIDDRVQFLFKAFSNQGKAKKAKHSTNADLL